MNEKSAGWVPHYMHAWDGRGLPSVLRPRVGHGRYGCVGNKSVHREALQFDPVRKPANRIKRTQLEWPGLDAIDHGSLFDICGKDCESTAV